MKRKDVPIKFRTIAPKKKNILTPEQQEKMMSDLALMELVVVAQREFMETKGLDKDECAKYVQDFLKQDEKTIAEKVMAIYHPKENK